MERRTSEHQGLRGPGAALLAVLLAAATPLFGSSARAQGPPPAPVGILALELGQSLPPAAQTELRSALRKGLGPGAVIGEADAKAALARKAPTLAGCRSGACLAQVGEALATPLLLLGEIGEEMGTYSVRLQGLEARSGDLLGERSWECEICTLREATQGLQREASAFRVSLAESHAARVQARARQAAPAPAPARGRLSVWSEPDGAEVVLDGAVLGRTPTETSLEPGEYTLEFRLEGHQDLRRVVTMGSKDLRVEQKLHALPAPAPPAPLAEPGEESPVLAPPEPATPGAPAAPGWSRRRLAYVGLGLGLAATAVGAALVALDGEPTCDGALETCPDLYDTGAAGIVTSALGGGLLIGSAILFLMEQRQVPAAPAEPVALAPARLRLLPFSPAADLGGISFAARF